MIYFLRVKDMPFVKIGFTNSKSFLRIKAYNTHSPFEHELLLFIEGDLAKEKELQKLFRKHCLKREWFNLSKEIEDFISDNKIYDVTPNPTIKEDLYKDTKVTRLIPETLRIQATNMYSEGVDLDIIAKFLGLTKKQTTKICYDRGARRPNRIKKKSTLYHRGNNKRAYFRKKYEQGKITLEELEEVYKEYPPKTKKSKLPYLIKNKQFNS